MAAWSADYRPIKYSLFPPLGLATLAAHLDESDEVEICDEHVAPITLGDAPDLVAIEVYVTSARRAYELARTTARGAHVCLGGLHVTAPKATYRSTRRCLHDSFLPHVRSHTVARTPPLH